MRLRMYVTLPEVASARLVAAANEQGGRDNVTVVVARFGDVK